MYFNGCICGRGSISDGVVIHSRCTSCFQGCGCINYYCVETIIHLINGDVFWYDVVVGWWGRCLCFRIGSALGDCNCKQPTQQSSKLSTKSSNQQCNEPKLEPYKIEWTDSEQLRIEVMKYKYPTPWY